MASPKDIARSYPKRGLTADIGFRSEPFFCGDGSFDSTQNAGNAIQFDPDFTFTNGLSVTYWMWHNGENATRYNGFFGQVAFGSISAHTLRFHSKQLGASYDVANAFEARSWHHVCFTLSQDGTAVKCYLNGVEQTLSAQPASALTLPSGSGITDAGIATFQNNASAGVLSMGGHMAKYALYNAVLTENQVRQIMRAQTFAEVNAIQACQFYFELAANNTDSTGNATTVEDRGTVTYGVTKPQLPRGLDLVRGVAQARAHAGRCVQFDGSSDVLGGEKYEGGTTKATFCVWFNADTLPAAQSIFSNALATGLDSKAQMYLQSTNKTLRVDDTADMIAFTGVDAGQWHFVAGVYDSTNGIEKAYLNGVIGGSPATYGSGNTTTKFTIGGRNQSAQQPFDGKISNFKIFNVELSQDQIRELYHNPEQVLPTGVSASNLRRHYPLSDYNDTGGTGGRYFQDMGADGKAVEDLGSASMAFAQPVPCPQLGLQQSATRLHHPGASQGAAATITAPGTTVSLSAWILWDQARTSYPIALGTVTSATDSFNIRINTSGQVTLYQNAEYLSGLTITEGGWNHIVFATRSDSPYWRCWLNNSEASSPAVANVTNITSTDCRLGMNSSSFGMGGIANDAAVWNTELGDSDVAALYNSGVQGMDVGTVQASNLKGWWKFDDLATLKDYSGNSANATVSGTFAAVQFPENASGSTLVGDFSMKRKGASVLNCFNDPGAQHVRSEIPSGAGLQPSLTNGHTVTCWYRNQKQNTTSANNGTMILGGNDGSNDRFILEAFNGNTFRGIYGALTANGTATISDNEWHHYAMVLDVTTASPTVRLYLDGVAAGTNSGSVSTTFPEGIVVVGGLNTTTTRATFDYGLKGPIACPRIYAFQLSENEIKQIYHADERLIKGLNNE